MRISEDPELNNLMLKDKWDKSVVKSDIEEWSDEKIAKLIKDNDHFVKGIVNLFTAGSTIPLLVKMLPPFELKKLSSSKLSFEYSALVDTIVRYKEKGSYAGKRKNNPESYIQTILEEAKFTFEKGDLPKLEESEQATKRKMDFIIPDKNGPRIIIECSYVTTTTGVQGDKAKVEIAMRDLIKQYYPQAKFIGFVDGIGWFVRKQDLLRMVEAYEEVFTLNQTDIARFLEFVKCSLAN